MGVMEIFGGIGKNFLVVVGIIFIYSKVISNQSVPEVSITHLWQYSLLTMKIYSKEARNQTNWKNGNLGFLGR